MEIQLADVANCVVGSAAPVNLLDKLKIKSANVTQYSGKGTETNRLAHKKETINSIVTIVPPLVL